MIETWCKVIWGFGRHTNREIFGTAKDRAKREKQLADARAAERKTGKLTATDKNGRGRGSVYNFETTGQRILNGAQHIVNSVKKATGRASSSTAFPMLSRPQLHWAIL